MGTSKSDKQKLTNRWIAIDQTPSPITPAARALDLKEFARTHKVYRVDYTPRTRQGKPIRRPDSMTPKRK